MAIEQMLSEEMPASALVARVLEEAGIEMVFGISGGHTGRIVSGLSKYQNSIRTVLVREESQVTFRFWLVGFQKNKFVSPKICQPRGNGLVAKLSETVAARGAATAASQSMRPTSSLNPRAGKAGCARDGLDTLKQKAAEGQPHSKTLARVTTLPNRRQLLECACPSGAFSRLDSTCRKSVKSEEGASRSAHTPVTVVKTESG